MCFIALTTQAFDRVRLRDVTTLIKGRKIHPNIIKVIKDLNIDNYTYIRMKNELITGITQGDSLRPTLFRIVMAEITNKVKQAGRGYRMENKEIRIVSYADDAVIISKEEDNLQRRLYKCEQIAKAFNMQIFLKITKSSTVSREPRRYKLAIYDQSVEHVMSFKYLGANITSNRNVKNEVKAQTTKASLISGYLKDVI
ncbi:uncharacterized protein LOC130444672 [Diorhabda sublineata]|uniref:uncharacterized protein LOC130444672 n=1 Tax=Diorhabda sublineata TaxID=1163346 RepID=UPI0024E15F07|nr:uncharacterized protein LOC130444672 [Diorhabda sublineata]